MEVIKSENEKLTKEDSDLEKVVEKLTEAKRKFEDMLGKRRSLCNKEVIGYNMNST